MLPPAIYFRTNVPLAPLPFLTTSKFVSNFSMVPVADLFRTDTSSALLIFNEMFFPLMTQARDRACDALAQSAAYESLVTHSSYKASIGIE